MNKQEQLKALTEAKFAEFGLKKVAEKSKNNWASLRFELRK